MKTYQDLEKATDLPAFILDAIGEHKASEIYCIAADAEEYDRQNNVTIMRYQKILYTAAGQAVVDQYSPNHKICSNFFNRFVTQENQYLLGNGLTLEDQKNKELLGRDFDQRLQQMGRNALVQGVSFGFWNLNHLEVFKLTEFVPLYDENTSTLMGGIRFFQIDADKPLRATLYEIDGYTDYIQKDKGQLVIENPKRGYIKTETQTEAQGVINTVWENYGSFPIIPLWANDHHQSELVGLRQSIDAYDLIKSGFANDLDGNLVYWILKNSGGMDDEDIAKFIDRIKTLGAASSEDGEDIKAQEIPIPYESRVAYLDRLEQDMYNDFQALRVSDISSGNKTATEINAAYQPFDNKVDGFEYCVLQFLENLFRIIGLDETPTLNRSKIASRNDDMQTLLLAANYLTDDYLIHKICAILGDPDMADQIIKERESDNVNRLLGGEPDEDGSGASGDGEDSEETGEEDQ